MAALQQISPGQEPKGLRRATAHVEHVGVDHGCHCQVCALRSPVH